jgi:DNA-directed RNA polymerase subunit omega
VVEVVEAVVLAAAVVAAAVAVEVVGNAKEIAVARLTVEDCLAREGNRFALVLLAAIRAKQLAHGAVPRVVSHNRVAVLALREIAAGRVRFNESVEDVVATFVAEKKLQGAEVQPRALSRLSTSRAEKVS